MPEPRELVDPYELLYLGVQPDLRRATGQPVGLTEKQIREAVAAMAAVIAACGLTPAVEGDTMHPRVLEGLAGLEAIQQHQAVHHRIL